MSDTKDNAQENNINIDITEKKDKIEKSVRKFSDDAYKLKDHLLKVFPNGVDLENLIDLVLECLKFLSSAFKMTGQQKKKVAINAILLLLDETNSGELEVFEPIVKSMVPATIDTLIDVEKKKIVINKKVKKLLFCCF